MCGLFHIKDAHFLSARVSCRLGYFLCQCCHKLFGTTREDGERFFGQASDPGASAAAAAVAAGCGGRIHDALNGRSGESERLTFRERCICSRSGSFGGGPGRALATLFGGGGGGFPLPPSSAASRGAALDFALALARGLSACHRRRCLLPLGRSPGHARTLLYRRVRHSRKTRASLSHLTSQNGGLFSTK